MHTSLARPTAGRELLFAVRGILVRDAIPLLPTVICIALSVVVHNEVIFVQSFAHNLLVLIFVDLFIQVLHIVDLIRVESLLAGQAEGLELGKLGASLGSLPHVGRT
jgi:hypothetical protein